MTERSNKVRLLDTGLWTAALIMGVYLLIIIFGDHGLMALRSMRNELGAAEAKNARVEQQNSALYRTIHRLKNDPEYIEYMARHELHMVGPEEIVFKFPAKEKTAKNE